MMRIAISVLIVVLAPQSASSAAAPGSVDRSAVVRVRGHRAVRLSAGIARAIAGGFPGFVPFTSADYLPWIDTSFHYSDRSAPFAAIGDFNGDGLEDVALHGHTTTETFVAVALSGRGRYRVAKRHIDQYRDPKTLAYGGGGEWQHGLDGFVQLARRGRLWSPTLGYTLRLGTDGYMTVAFERGSSLYLYRRGQWQYYPVAD